MDNKTEMARGLLNKIIQLFVEATRKIWEAVVKKRTEKIPMKAEPLKSPVSMCSSIKVVFC